MKRLEVLKLVELAEQLARLSAQLNKDKAPPFDFYIAMATAEDLLTGFADSQAAFPLSRQCAREAANEIRSSVTAHFYVDAARSKFKENMPNEYEAWQFWQVKKAVQSFDHVFSAECRNSETYFMEKKVGFDIQTLLHQADENLHETIRPFVPGKALTELREAGRCLALESYTASGFHTLRGLEIVMAAYYKAVSQSAKEFKSWFDYVEALEELSKEKNGAKPKYPSPKVTAMLDRMRQLDRNPLMHPSDTLDEVGADSLFKLGIVTITEIAKDLRDMAGQTELKLVPHEAVKAIAAE